MSADDFDAYFDHFTRTAVRLETLPAYAVGGAEQKRLDAFRARQPRPLRSVRTDPWLARIAITTATAGKSWVRYRIVDDPLTEYQQYGLASLIESQSAGEQVHLVRRGDVPDSGPDAWLFDHGTPGAFALVMRYTPDGRWLGFEHTADPNRLTEIMTRVQTIAEQAIPLNVFLASVASG